MFAKNKEVIINHPIVRERKIKIVTQIKYLGVILDSKLDWYPHTLYLENKVLSIRNNLVRCSTANWGLTFHNLLTIYKCAILPVITYASEAWCTTVSKKAKGKLQQIQRAYLLFITKAYKTVSNEALSTIAGVMPIEQAIQLHQDKRAIARGKPTNAVITALKYVETPTKNRDIHPKDNYVKLDLSGSEGKASATIYTDGSKTENHVGASVVVLKDSKETHINIARLNADCTVFQAELYGISMAMKWIQRQKRSTPACAINVDSKAALLSIANKHTTHPLATAIRENIIN